MPSATTIALLYITSFRQRPFRRRPFWYVAITRQRPTTTNKRPTTTKHTRTPQRHDCCCLCVQWKDELLIAMVLSKVASALKTPGRMDLPVVQVMCVCLCFCCCFLRDLGAKEKQTKKVARQQTTRVKLFLKPCFLCHHMPGAWYHGMFFFF